MSGINRESGINRALENQSVKLDKLDKLVALDSRGIKLNSDGTKYRDDMGMVFRSGMNFILREKSEDDVTANRATLQSILNYVHEQVGGDTVQGNKLYEQILNRKTSLAGDDGQSYTIAERLERGTYVSSELVGQIKYATGRVVEAHDEVFQNQKKFMPGNLRVIDDFVGWDRGTTAEKVHQETGLDFIGDAIVNLASGVKDAIFGKKDPPFVEVVREVCEQGTAQYGPENKDLWKTVSRNLLGRDGNSPYIPPQLQESLRHAALLAAKEGREVTHEDLKEATAKYFNTIMVMPPYVQATNHNTINTLTPGQLADSLEKWPELNDRPDLQQAADWLAAKVRTLGTEGQDQVGLLDQVKKLISGKGDDGRDVGKMFDDMYAEVKANHQKNNPPPNLTGRELREWHRDNVPLDQIRDRILHPKVYDSQSIAGLMGNAPESLLEMYKQDLDNLDRNERRVKEQSESTLRDNLPSDLFPHLSATKERMSLESYQKIGMPETAKDFMKSVMMEQIGRDEYRRLAGELQERSDTTEQGLSPEAQNKLRQNTEMYVKNNDWMLDEILTPFETAIEFRQQVEEVRNAPGGFEKASPETLARLDDKASELSGDARKLVDYAQTLRARYGDDGVAADTLAFAAGDLLDFLGLYRNESGRDARETARLSAQNEQVEKAYEDLQKLVRGERIEIKDVDWVSKDANEKLERYPQLKQYAGDLDRPGSEELAPRNTVAEVVRDLVQPNGEPGEGWTDIAPGLAALDSYAELADEYNRLDIEGMRKMPINELEELRQRTMATLASAGQLEQSVSLIHERYGNEGGRLHAHLDLAVEQVRNASQTILDDINQVRTERAPGVLPRLPDIGWAHGGLKDRLEAFPSLHKLAHGADIEKAPYLANMSTINTLMQGLVEIPHKLGVDRQFNQLTPDGIGSTIDGQRDADEAWNTKVQPRLQALDDFAVLQQEVRLLGREGLRNLSVEERQTLRERAETAHRESGRVSYAGNIIISSYAGNPDIPLAQISDALDEAAKRMRVGAQNIVEELGGFGDPLMLLKVKRNDSAEIPTPETRAETTDTTDQVAMRSGTVGTNPFDDEGPTVTNSTNPFDDDGPTVTNNTNPFDDDGPTVTNNTNPFDDGDDVEVGPGTDAPQEQGDVGSTRQSRLPDIGWATDGLQRQLDVLPELHGLARNMTVQDNAALTRSDTVGGMLYNMTVVPYLTNIDERLPSSTLRQEAEVKGKGVWNNRIESRLDSVDRFARLQNDWLTLGDGGRDMLSVEERTTLRNEARGVLDSLDDMRSGVTIMIGTYSDDPKIPVGEYAGALLSTADRMDAECRKIIAALGDG